MDTVTLQIAQRGVVTLPKNLRDTYHLSPGDEITLLDLGGVFVLSPRRSQIDALADSMRDVMVEKGLTLEEMLTELRETRENNE